MYLHVCNFAVHSLTGQCPQANIKECDLQVSVGSFNRGPGRLATQLINPLSGFEVIHVSQPFLSLSRRVSSSEVFVVDKVVVIFVGLSNGHVQKVYIYCCVKLIVVIYIHTCMVMCCFTCDILCAIWWKQTLPFPSRQYATRDMNTNPAPERTWSLSSK